MAVWFCVSSEACAGIAWFEIRDRVIEPFLPRERQWDGEVGISIIVQQNSIIGFGHPLFALDVHVYSNFQHTISQE